MAIIRNLEMDQGATFDSSVTLYNPNKTSFDLTGYTATAQMRKSYGTNTIAATFTATITAPTTGAITLSLTDEQTALIKAGRYVYDVYVESAIGEKYRVIEGVITVSPGVTR